MLVHQRVDQQICHINKVIAFCSHTPTNHISGIFVKMATNYTSTRSVASALECQQHCAKHSWCTTFVFNVLTKSCSFYDPCHGSMGGGFVDGECFWNEAEIRMPTIPNKMSILNSGHDQKISENMIGIGVGNMFGHVSGHVSTMASGYPAVGDECFFRSSKATEAQRCCWFDGTAMTAMILWQGLFLFQRQHIPRKPWLGSSVVIAPKEPHS